MTQLRDIAVVVLLIVALAFGLVLRSQYKATAQLKVDLDVVTKALATEQKLRSADVKSLTTRLQAAQKAQEAKEKRDVQTAKALAANPVWSSEHVPDDVVDALGL